MSLRCFPTLMLASAGWISLWGQPYTINTVAGNGTPGFSGDGGAANQAQLSLPGGVAIDPSGNIYIADAGNHCVRKVSNGIISTVAGTAGKAGYSGDKAAATSATLRNPTGVALDSSGNLYIADAGNNVIRQVATSGTITTFAGNGGADYLGDGGAATSASLNDPVALAVDSAGNLYIADAGNNVIREVSGGNINTIVGSSVTTEQLHHPDGIARDAAGNLYIADTVARRVLEFSGGAVTVLAGNQEIGFGGDNGPATQAALFDPMGVAVDASGNVYIADTFNSRIREITRDGNITTIAGTGYPAYFGDGGPALSATLYFPRSVAVDASGNIYVSDTSSNALRVLQTSTPSVTSNSAGNAPGLAPKSSLASGSVLLP
ncbi:MAG TPA: NHL repeat-containing protein [Bryobacteraceae bacterium]|nr:NHL repeat-containing protein [Bryobacteraceae bacterium]